jgi:Putative transposase
VLHTWTRDLRFHPHLHCIATGGGLTRDGTRWRVGKRTFLFRVRVLSALFRGKLLAALHAEHQKCRLKLDGVNGFDGGRSADKVWKRLSASSTRPKWVVYAKRPFAGPESVYQ